MNELREILRALAALDGPAVLCTLVAVAGSSYRRPGARMLVTHDWRRTGSISGGCLEEDVIARAEKVLRTGQAEVVTYDTTSENDVIWGVGMGCHGIVQVLLEPLPAAPPWASVVAATLERGAAARLAVVWQAGSDSRGTRLGDTLPAVTEEAGVFHQTIEPPTPLIIFGAGDDAKPLARFGRELGWLPIVADPRPAFPMVERFPEAHRVAVIRTDADLAAQLPELGPRAAVVVMTHHYTHDLPLLRQLLPQPLAYLGLLGPRKRAEKILADLAADGAAFAPEGLAQLHAPVGLDLGAEDATEIALSIVAEIRAVLGGRDARPLRQRAHPIHG